MQESENDKNCRISAEDLCEKVRSEMMAVQGLIEKHDPNGELISRYGIHTDAEANDYYGRMCDYWGRLSETLQSKNPQKVIETNKYEFITVSAHEYSKKMEDLIMRGWKIVSAYPSEFQSTKPSPTTTDTVCTKTNYVLCLSELRYEKLKDIDESKIFLRKAD